MKVAAGAVLVAVVFVVDWVTGSEISFSIFYLMPVALVAVTAGWGGAVFISILSGVAWVVADYFGGSHYSAAWIPLWNTLMRIMIFMLVARLLIQLIAERDKAAKAEVAAQRATQAKSDFLANMSHEIRTPLNALLGVAQLFGETGLNARQSEFVKIFRTEGEQLRRLINDVLDLSKAEAGKIHLELKPFHLGHMARSMVQTFSPHAAEKGLQLEAVIAPAADRAWLGDSHRLRQVLANLLGNALKFTDAGQIVLAIETGEPHDGTPTVKFSVQDTGAGIDPKMQDRLFQRYQQLENRTLSQAAGTGLGLSISRALVEAMGGSLHVESEPGRGSTFYFSVPLVPASLPDETPATPRTRTERMESLTGKSVLLVEDYKTNQLIFAEYLDNAGCRTTLAANGREAVERFMADPFDVVIMDMQMPVLDGWSATREIRAWEMQNRRSATPILALTASALNEDRERCREAGCTHFLSKPLLRVELLEALASLVGAAANKSSPPSADASLQRLLPMFLDETRKGLADIRQALAATDWPQVSRAGHQMAGSGATFGHPEITTLGRQLETAATERNAPRIRELANALEDLLSTLPPT